MKTLATVTSSAVSIHGLLALLLNKKVAAAFEILCASLFIGLTSQIKIPLPFTPVPLVGTTFGVILVSALLGSRRATLAALCYLVQGSIGLPVWAGGAAGLARLMGPMGGYYLAYPLEAFLVGYSLEKISFSFPKILTALFLISCLHLTIGSLWLGPFVGFNHCFLLGLVPFVGVEFFKVLITTIYLKVKKS